MKLPAIKKLVETYTIAECKAAEEALLNGEIPAIEIDGDDEGEQLTHILGAIDVLERVHNENKDVRTALRNFFDRVRSSIS
jgi:hypothetical protein